MINIRHIVATIIVALTMLTPCEVTAQYYSWGSDAPSLRWSEIKDPNVRIIYPDTVDAIARRTLLYINNAKSDIDFGFKYPALNNLPFVMHPENFESNALVMWMPKRIDFLTTPSIDSYSMPWAKQLVAHEYRHAVQYNNLNKGVVKVLSYILGQQGSALGLLLLPVTIIEGDAVKCETSMSSYGRGLQPSFSMGYRAIGRDAMLTRRNIDRWYCGSYLEYIPDHYQFGYQIVDFSYTHFGENIWNKVVEFGVRRPYYIVTVSSALKKYYGLDNTTLVRKTFNDLFDYWDTLPERDNTAEIIAPIDTTTFTTYSDPIPLDEGRVLALRENYNDHNRFVIVDSESGEEERLRHIGSLSTRPSLGGDGVWWSEYRQSNMFQQRVNSRLCYLDLDRNNISTIKGFKHLLYPTVIDSESNHLAYVEYAPSGQYSIVEIKANNDKIRNNRDFDEISRTKILFPTEVHGLAWDDTTEALYFIATDDSGMWLGEVDSESESGFRQITEGAYITLRDLRAEGGQLYFGSIESGYDELHCYDIASRKEYRMSESTYGSFDPSTPSAEGYSYATTYDRYGYHLSRQKVDTAEMWSVTHKRLPQNIVNPPRTKWDLVNLDSVRYTPADSVASHKEHKAHKYNKGAKLFDVHSWMPFAFNPFDLSAEQVLDISVGATAISQNLLSNTEAYASYGYNFTEGSLVNGSIMYNGLGVELEVGGSYGGNQIIYDPFENSSTGENKYHSITTGTTLPILLDNGYHVRYLSVGASWNYTNGLVLDLDKIVYDEQTDKIINYDALGYNEGLHKMVLSVGYSDVVRSAMRDLATPWGYTISAAYAMTPGEDDFSNLLSIYGKIYTRGLFASNSFSIAANYQNSIGGYKINGVNLLSFSSVALLPRGFSSTDIVNRDYLSTSLNYQFPVWYPEGGIGSVLYFRRISLNLGFDAARFDNYGTGIEHIYSYGGDIVFDINPLRMPSASTMAIKASLYKPSVGPLSFTFGMELPF